MDLEKALLDPTSVFAEPEDVISRTELNRDQKVAILERWLYDARELAVAEEEGMGGSGDGAIDRVLAALLQLGVDDPGEGTAPSKQG